MASANLIAHRPIEDLVLDINGNVRIPGKFVQYLFVHQINGIRFLYKNFQKQNACILNDESGLGKCFQIVMFLNAIYDFQRTKYILIICKNKDRILHWMYHVEILTDGIQYTIADNMDSQENVKKYLNNSVGHVIFATIGFLSENLDTFKSCKYDCIIFDNTGEELQIGDLAKLYQLDVASRIISCNNDLVGNLKYFYEILKFCNQLAPLTTSSQGETHLLNVKEFGKKYGSTDDDKSLSQRSIMLRHSNLLNTCKEFYIRRLRQQHSIHLPLIEPNLFNRSYERWKLAYCDTVPFIEETSSSQGWPIVDSTDVPLPAEALEPVLTTPPKPNSSLQSNHNESESHSECQMSPLIYDNSDSELDDEKEDNNTGNDKSRNQNCESQQDGSDTRNENSSDTIIQAGQIIPSVFDDSDDLFADLKSVTIPQEAVTRRTSKKGSNDSIQTNIETRNSKKEQKNWKKLEEIPTSSSYGTRSSNIAKSNKFGTYHKLCIEIKETLENETRGKNSRRDKSSKQVEPIEEIDDQSISILNSLTTQSGLRKRSTPDVQIFSQKIPSPITVRSSSSENRDIMGVDSSDTNFDSEMISSSPDLFNETLDNSNHNTKNRRCQKVTDENDDKNIMYDTEDDIFNHIVNFDESRNSISKLTTKTTDIFEITKNNVFPNVLRVRSDTTITPVPNISWNVSATKVSTCFSGIKVAVPGCSSVTEEAGPSIKRQSGELKNNPKKNDESFIDLTATSTPLLTTADREKLNGYSSSDEIEIISTPPELETTPKRKQQLTPSTRSCLKRLAEPHDLVDAKAKTTSPNKSGWIHSKRSLVRRSLNNGTPTRRSLRYPQSTHAKPRNIVNEFDNKKSESPHIVFSSEEDQE